MRENAEAAGGGEAQAMEKHHEEAIIDDNGSNCLGDSGSEKDTTERVWEEIYDNAESFPTMTWLAHGSGVVGDVAGDDYLEDIGAECFQAMGGEGNLERGKTTTSSNVNSPPAPSNLPVVTIPGLGGNHHHNTSAAMVTEADYSEEEDHLNPRINCMKVVFDYADFSNGDYLLWDDERLGKYRVPIQRSSRLRISWTPIA